MSHQAVVLAGGLATRLGERTRETPKYLIPVAGRPFAAWQLERIAACGFRRVLLCIGHLGEAIRDALGDGASYGIELSYAEDGPRPLGTGGALRAAEPLLDDSFIVTYGDSYLPFDYAAPLVDLRDHEDALGCMAVYENDGRYDRSNVRLDGERVAAYAPVPGGRPYRHIDYGVTALRRSALQRMPEGPSDLGRLQAELAAGGRLRALEVTERFYEIGSARGLAELDAWLR